MTPAQRLGIGLVVSAVSCAVSTVFVERAEIRVFVVALLVLAYAASIMDVTAAVYAAVMAWALAVAFLLGLEQIASAPATLALLVTAAVAGTCFGSWRARQ